MELAEEIIKLEQAHTSARSQWEPLWQELADIAHPRRGLITVKATATDAPETSKINAQSDGTAMRAARVLANGQASRITPRGARWFKFKPPTELKDNDAAKKWYGECTEIVAEQLEASNFYNRAKEHFLDRGVFGTAATECTTPSNGSGLHFRSFPIGSYSIADNANDEVDTIVRTYNRTPIQLEQEFDKLPKEVLELLKTPTTAAETLEVIHVVRPRTQRDPRLEDAENKPFQSVHVLKKFTHVLRESGFDEFPVAVSRWETWGDSPWGWAPSYLALPEATQANFLEQMRDTLVELKAFPRVLYGANLKGDIDFAALGLTCYDDTSEAPTEWLTQGSLDAAIFALDDKRKAIDEAFFVHLFSAISRLRSDATAEQVRAIRDESSELFHPIFSGTTREFLGPILRRAFNICARQGLFPEAPPEIILTDEIGEYIGDPDVSYTSTMALIFEQSHIANLIDAIQTLALLQDEEAFDHLDTDEVAPSILRFKGLPESFIRSEEKVKERRALRQQAAEQERQLAAAQALPDDVVKDALS